MNDKELQQAFLQFLAQKSGAKTQKELEQYVQSLGEDGLKQAYQEFTQIMQKQAQKAAHGAKLQYFKRLKNQCNEDEELVYYKKGGMVECGCQKKETGGTVDNKPKKSSSKAVNDFKNRKQPQKRLDPKNTPTLPGGKYPSYWTSQERQTWERLHGDNDEGAAATTNKGVGQNKKGGNIKINCGGSKLNKLNKGKKVKKSC